MSQELSYLISYAFKYLYPEMQYVKDSNITHTIQDVHSGIFQYTVLNVIKVC